MLSTAVWVTTPDGALPSLNKVRETYLRAHARSLMSEIFIDTYAASSGIPTVRTHHAGNVNYAARRDR
jgi:hypothetical protein